MDTTVKYFHSGMTGAPQIANFATGNFIPILDVVLKDGLGLATVDSLVVSGGVATVTRAAGHPMEVHTVTLIAGASILNGEHRVLSAVATSYTFDATGLGDQTATGTITHKLAPMGWEKAAFSVTGIAAYRSLHPQSPAPWLRVDDTNGYQVRVVAYRSMTDINTGVEPFPTDAQASGGGYWAKANNTNSSARPWVIVGDARGFTYWVNYNTSSFGTHQTFFGDFISKKVIDPYASIVTYNSVATQSSGGAFTSDLMYSATGTNSTAMQRAVTGLGTSQIAGRMPISVPVSNGSIPGYSGTTTNGYMTYPGVANNELFLSQMSIQEFSPSLVWRGTYPGVWFCPMAMGPGTFQTKDSVPGGVGLTGRILKALGSSSGVSFVDITGPWR